MSERGIAGNLFGLLFESERSFAALLPPARFWIPLALHVALSLGFTAVWMAKVDPVEFFRAELEWSGQADRIPAEQQATILQAQARMFPVMGWLGGALGAPLLVAFVAAAYSLVFRFFLGSEIPFRKTLTVAAWSLATVACVQTPLILTVLALKADWAINPGRALQANLAIALERESAPRFFYSVLESLDLFTLWTLSLLHAGFKVGTGLTPRTVAIAVTTPWALWVLLKAGLAALRM